jgi:hypothetical protein
MCSVACTLFHGHSGLDCHYSHSLAHLEVKVVIVGRLQVRLSGATISNCPTQKTLMGSKKNVLCKKTQVAEAKKNSCPSGYLRCDHEPQKNAVPDHRGGGG